MSWFDTIKHVANVVVRNTLASTVPPCSIASAVPTHFDGFWSSLSDAQSSSGVDVVVTDESHSDNEGQAEASQSTDNIQVNTRARYTYELDRFQKNALLMFVQIRSQSIATGRVEETTKQDLEAVSDTFKGFRFEVNTHTDLTCSEIDNKCQEFFQQNFRDYGAIVVVVLTYEGSTGELAALDGRFPESIILRHLTDDLNPTLLAKPKIYITEANRIVSSESGSRFSLSLEEHSDVLGLHLPTIDHANMTQRPLLLLCNNINRMADTNDFVTILKKSVDDIQTEAASIFENKPIELSANFTKEMILARSEST